jgi:hypothetical protein
MVNYALLGLPVILKVKQLVSNHLIIKTINPLLQLYLRTASDWWHDGNLPADDS